ncbi:HAD family hydrolase [Thalassoglobus sp.]|uniref:HAD family hydrolase n=1 Tax=Thalassoglobus sp. TaxID=2795869 RepID=UPI003AA93183
MGLSLAAYIDELHQRSDLIWPNPPAIVPMKVTPSLKPLPGIKAVTWSVYGTLLQIEKGVLLHHHEQEIRMQIALEKTIKEFNMWNSMTRRKGQPWEGMLIIYNRIREDLGMVSSKQKGDFPEIDSAQIWKKVIGKLELKEYTYDQGKYGDVDDFVAKIAYFFHASLQGAKAVKGSRDTLAHLTDAGIRQGLIADGQAFTIPQLLHALKQQGSFASLAEVLSASLMTISYQQKIRKPSPSLYRSAKESFKKIGIQPEEVLHVSHRLKDDLAVAKKMGFRTALFASDKSTCNVTASDVRDPDMKPDRLISEIAQVRDILQV